MRNVERATCRSTISSACLVRTEASNERKEISTWSGWIQLTTRSTIGWVVGRLHAREISSLLNTTTSAGYTNMKWDSFSAKINSNRVEKCSGWMVPSIIYICNGKMSWTHRWLGSVITNQAPLENFKFTRNVEQHIYKCPQCPPHAWSVYRERKYSARSHNTDGSNRLSCRSTCVWDRSRICYIIRRWCSDAKWHSFLHSQKRLQFMESSKQCPRDDASFGAAASP